VLTRSIVKGTPYPEGLFAAVIRRVRAERKISYLKAAILKAILTRNYETPMSTTLDKDHPSKGYHLGRLFAVFEQSQRQAHEFKLERTIRETFYSAASANPLSVFSRLHRLHMHHLRKLSGGSQKYFEDWIGEIEQKFASTPESAATYPATLNLKEQGLFSIGYYHQMHAMKHKENN
jgi:CRISPR-associated protein Csd1